MCVVSMVHDHYDKLIPRVPPWVTTPEPGICTDPVTKPRRVVALPKMPTEAEIKRLQKVIDDFREAMKAAEKVDVLTAQPDCVDPEKAKLKERVAYLEAELKKVRERKPKRTSKK